MFENLLPFRKRKCRMIHVILQVRRKVDGERAKGWAWWMLTKNGLAYGMNTSPCICGFIEICGRFVRRPSLTIAELQDRFVFSEYLLFVNTSFHLR